MLLLAGGLSGCVKHEYDLGEVDTDNVTVGGELVMPLGTVRFDFRSLLPQAGTLQIALPGTFPTQSLGIGSGFDTGILDKLDETTPITVTTVVTNCVSEPLLITVGFSDGNGDPVVLCDEATVKSATEGTTTVTSTLTMEEFRRVAGATRIDFGFSTVDKQPKNDVTVTDDATLLFVFSVRKSGGIKL